MINFISKIYNESLNKIKNELTEDDYIKKKKYIELYTKSL